VIQCLTLKTKAKCHPFCQYEYKDYICKDSAKFLIDLIIFTDNHVNALSIYIYLTESITKRKYYYVKYKLSNDISFRNLLKISHLIFFIDI